MSPKKKSKKSAKKITHGKRKTTKPAEEEIKVEIESTKKKEAKIEGESVTTVTGENILYQTIPQEKVSFANQEISDQETSEKTSLRVSGNGKKAMIIFIALAVFLVLLISFIALPTATIYIDPLAKEEVFATSITFADRTINQHDLLINKPNFVATEPMSYTLELSHNYPATGELFEGQPAQGEITIYNRGAKPKEFIPSRFQTQDGLIFWIDSKITIPARKDAETPGEITVSAHAADYDAFGRAVGSRGNIPAGQQLSMPAIPYLSPLLYYGVNKKPFTGGTAIISKIILQEDIDMARQRIEIELAQQAENLMKDKITSRNQNENRNDTLLSGEGVYDYEVESIEIEKDILGKKQDNFPATVRMKIIGRVYNRDDLYRILIEGLKNRVHPDMDLSDVDFAGMEMTVIERDNDKELLRINIEVRGRMVYDFDIDNTSGKNMISRLRKKLAGQSVEWAKRYLQNLEEVNSADITTWPFWRKKLPSVEGNIKVKIKE